jgi:hypothetical protein
MFSGLVIFDSYFLITLAGGCAILMSLSYYCKLKNNLR